MKHVTWNGSSLEVKDCAQHHRRDETPFCQLTPRQCDILALIARGYTNQQIARALKLNRRTVESHINLIRNDLGLTPAECNSRVLGVIAGRLYMEAAV